jgi:hypothetical protein
MAFSKENKITWEELAPSTQELFKQIQAQIVTERSQRISADDALVIELSSLEDDMNTYLEEKYNELERKANTIENIVSNIFDDENRLVFPNGDKFWIG